MNTNYSIRAVDAFRLAIPIHPEKVNAAASVGDLGVCSWSTPWIRGFNLPSNDDLVIALHREGRCNVRALRNDSPSEHQSAPGLITNIPAGRDWRFCVEGEVQFDTIHIPTSLVRSVAQRFRVADRSPDFRFAFRDHYVGACVDAILGETQTPGPKSEEFIRSVTESLTLHLLRSSNERLPEPPRRLAWVERTRALIEATTSDHLSLDDLAEEAGLSRSHFARLFRAETGVSPHRYLNLQRIEKAKQLLRESNMSLVNIALELGFCSQSYFTKVFHSVTGVTPRRFREGGADDNG